MFKFLSYIDKNKVFFNIFVKVLKNIKYCVVIISILFVVGMLFFYLMVEIDDVLGIIVIGLVIIFVLMVIVVFVVVF